MSRVFLIFLCFLTAACNSNEKTKTGLDRIDEFQNLFSGKRVGLVVNHTSLNKAGDHITDIFLHMPDVTVAALFGPEHGVRGQAADGEQVGDGVDAIQNIPVYSLYGKTKKPTAEMLENVDVLVFDIQDIGARFYTFIWTLFYVMQGAAENDIPIVVLDRPNPIGSAIEGPVLQPDFSSFVGLFPIPVRHGMTVGELARLYNGEGWLGDHTGVELTVVPMQNWRRNMWFDETGLPFTPTSPNMPDLQTAAIYPGLCLIEGTNVSEGRGTDAPFLTFGAPWINGDILAKRLNELKISGIEFKSTEFVPIIIPGKARSPKFENQRCKGVHINVVDQKLLDSFFMGVVIVKTIHDLYPQQFAFRKSGYFDLLCGTDYIRKSIERGDDVESIQASWQQSLEDFKKMRKKYLLYSENSVAK
jgi:uncharacterized protein YbbC (DUF1343 family)